MERKLSRRNILGAAGAFAGGAVLAGTTGAPVHGAETVRMCTVCDIPALRQRVAAIVAEFSGPLPAGDAGLFEAARRLAELRARDKALYREFPIDVHIEATEINPHIDPLDNWLDDYLIETVPQTLAGAAVILRHGLDCGVYFNGPGDELAGNVLALIDRLVAGGAA